MHLGHIGLSDEGFRPKNFSETVVKQLGLMVNPSDILMDLGDVCWGDYDYWFEQLSRIDCIKWLIRGNHDSKSISWYMARGYHMVCDGFRLEMFGKKILFTHIPVKDDSWYDLNIHGHFHSFSMERVKEKEPEIHKILTSKHVLVNIESTNYQPIKLKTLIERM